MPFLKFLKKDLNSNKTFNWFFVLCSTLGIVGLLLVESFRGGIEYKVATNAKNFIAGDLSISSRRAFEETETKAVKDYLHNKGFTYAEWTETYSLISKVKKDEDLDTTLSSKLADLNFISEPFPFYGGVVLEEKGERGAGQWGVLHIFPKAWVSRDLSWELGLKLGDVLKIGEVDFEVDGIIAEDQFSSFRGFNLAPKVFISANFMESTELIKFGSTATRSYIVKLPNGVNAKDVQKELRLEIPDKSIRIKTPEEANQQVYKSLEILADYLGLITLMTYLLSLVGLFYFTQHFLSRKIKTFSIFKSLGVKTSFLFYTNFSQLVLLTLGAVLFSTVLVNLVLPALNTTFIEYVKEDITFRLGAKSIIRILSLSLGGSLLALGPLYWGALQAPVATIFQDLPMELKRIRFYYFIPLFLYVVTLAILLSNSFKVGLLFIFAISLIVGLSAILFKGISKGLEKISDKMSFINKHSMKTLSRYFTSSFTIFICLLIGMTLTTFMLQLEKSIRHEFVQTHGDKRPDLFVFDIQDSQEEEFNELVEEENWTRPMFSPMIRGRLLKVNGIETQKRVEESDEDAAFQTREEEQSERIRNRGVNLSYRDKLSWSETIVAGKFNGNVCNPEVALCEISLEQSYARRLGAKLGDKLLFDISGVEVEGVVTSLRRVKWTSFEPNFFILFQPGLLEDAPKTFLSSIKAKSFEDRKQIFIKMAETFPTVSILEVSELVKKITKVFELMSMAVKSISFLSLFVALVVLVAVSFNHLELRKREMALYNMMGLVGDKIKKIYLREFIILISFCFFLSVAFGSLLTKIIMKEVFDSVGDYRLHLVLPIMLLLSLVLYFIVRFRINKLIKNRNLF